VNVRLLFSTVLIATIACFAISACPLASAAPLSAAALPPLPAGWVARHPIILRRTSAPHPGTVSNEVPNTANAAPPFTPSQITGAYGMDVGTEPGAGVTVAIVDAYGDFSSVNTDIIQSDLSTFSSSFGLPYSSASSPSPTVTEVFPDGKPASVDSGWASETALDVEWVHAIAPYAHIVLVITPNDMTLFDGISPAASASHILSMSWNGDEFQGEQEYDATYFATPNTTFFVASGDNGGTASGSSNPGVGYPDSSPYVTAVGGTSLTISGNNGYVSETGWPDSGGGISLYEGNAAFQAPWVSSGPREVPDVSADADLNTGVLLYNDGSWYEAGGTSLATPIWAGLMAVVDSGRSTPVDEASLQTALYSLYGSPSTLDTYFHDVTSGSNGPWTCAQGYDMVTGLGSMNGGSLIPALIDALHGALPAISSVSPSSGSTSGGTSVTITGTNLTGASAVYFGSYPASSFVVKSATTITAVAPAASAGVVNITVTTPAGTSATSAADQFTYGSTAPSVPVVTSVSPSSGSTAGGTVVTITGSNLSAATVVQFGTSEAVPPFTADTPTSITLVTPAGTAGTVDVTVSTAAGTSSLNPPGDHYTYTPVPTAPTPTITPNGGSYNAPVSVSIADTLANSTIYYTTNGSMPTTGSSKYTGPFTVSQSETVTAFAVESGYISSSAAAAVFDINVSIPAAPAPKIAPDGGTFTAPVLVSLADSLNGGRIHYTTNGATPTASSPQYTAAFTVSTSETVKAIAVATGYAASTVTSASFTIQSDQVAPTPTISPNGGTFKTSVSVTLSDAFSGASIYYTTNGAVPSPASTLYKGAFACSSSETVKAVAVASGYTNSGVASAAFTISAATGTVPTPTISPAAGTYTGSVSVRLADTVSGASIYYTTNGTVPTLASTKYTGAITVSQSETITAYAVASGYASSAAVSASYKITPAIVSLAQTAGPIAGGTPVTITGTGFISGATVKFGSVAATSVAVVTATSITCKSPAASAGSVVVTVTTVGGTGAASAKFTYCPVPTVARVSPAVGPVAGGTPVTITGSGFVSGATVKFGSVACGSIVVVSATTITCKSPAHGTGAIIVTVTTPGGTSATSTSTDAFTYDAVPAISALSPAQGYTTGGTYVTVTGTGFVSGATVKFGSALASSVVVVSSTSIKCVSPAGTVGVVAVSVSTPGGTSSASSVDKFTYVSTGFNWGSGS